MYALRLLALHINAAAAIEHTAENPAQHDVAAANLQSLAHAYGFVLAAMESEVAG